MGSSSEEKNDRREVLLFINTKSEQPRTSTQAQMDVEHVRELQDRLAKMCILPLRNEMKESKACEEDQIQDISPVVQDGQTEGILSRLGGRS